MQPILDAVAPIASALQIPLNQSSPKMTEKLAEMFPSNVDADELKAELEVFKNIVDQHQELQNS